MCTASVRFAAGRLVRNDGDARAGAALTTARPSNPDLPLLWLSKLLHPSPPTVKPIKQSRIARLFFRRL